MLTLLVTDKESKPVKFLETNVKRMVLFNLANNLLTERIGADRNI